MRDIWSVHVDKSSTNKRKMHLSGNDRAKHDNNLPSGKRAMAPQPAGVLPSVERASSIGEQCPSVKNGHLFAWQFVCSGDSSTWPWPTVIGIFGKEMSSERPVRQKAWYAKAYDGVMAVKRRIFRPRNPQICPDCPYCVGGGCGRAQKRQ